MSDTCKLVTTSWCEGEVLVLAGPTASGKSALAMAVAEATGAEIISADSMQIYRGMDIGTAKVSPAERRLVPHHMIDICDPDENFSVADYAARVEALLQTGMAEGRRFILCGGTGQYISALLDGLDFVEEKHDPDLRQALEARLATEGAVKLWSEIQALDPQQAERIHPNNHKRVIRFLELYHLTGQTMTELNRQSKQRGPRFRFQGYCLEWPREELYARIHTRCRQMFADGLLDELRALLAAYPQLETYQSFQAIGYKEALRCLRGEETEAEAVEALALATRHYAKRQLTWFRHQADLQALDCSAL